MSEPSVIDIDPQGDLLVICGSGDDQRRLRVSSTALRDASHIFDARIRRRFSEEGLNPTKPVEVVLPVPLNGSHALEVICNVLHKRYLSKEIAKGVLRHVLTLCEKYKLAPLAMRPAMVYWLGNHIALLDKISNETSTLVEFLGAALHFRLPDHITIMGLLLVKTSTGSLMSQPSPMFKVLPKFLTQLETIRQVFQDDLLTLVENEIKWQGNPCPKNHVSCHGNCKYAKKNVQDFAQHLASWSLWTPELVKANSLANTYMCFRHRDPDKHRADEVRQECAMYCTMVTAKSFKVACNDLLGKSIENQKLLDRWMKFDSTMEDGSIKGFRSPPPPHIWRLQRKVAEEIKLDLTNVDGKQQCKVRKNKPRYLAADPELEDAMEVDE
ncbi:hypothetical protein Q7P37_004805 [Cladosporium fusiforme]